MPPLLSLVILMTSLSLARAQCTVTSYPELCLAMADAAKAHCATFVVRGGEQAANVTAAAPVVCEVRRSVTIECDASAAPWVCDPKVSCILVSNAMEAMSVAVRGCRMLGHGVRIRQSNMTDLTLEGVSLEKTIQPQTYVVRRGCPSTGPRTWDRPTRHQAK